MTISIAMATCNGERYLAAQLESFLAQSRLPDELIVSDDSSQDKTTHIVQEFAREAPFHVHFEANTRRLGVTENFNRALGLASGDLVFLSDQDDVWFEDKIEVILKEREIYPGKLLFMNDAELTDAELKPINVTKLQQIQAAGMDEAAFVMGCCSAVDRRLLDFGLPIPQGVRGHDNWLVACAELLGARHIVRRPLQLYRRHGDNESDFIANRTTKIGRRHRRYQQLSRVLGSSDKQFGEQEIQLVAALVDRSESFLKQSGSDISVALESALPQLSARLAHLDERRKIRNLPWFRRVPSALRLWAGGQYQRSNGIHSLVRDMLG